MNRHEALTMTTVCLLVIVIVVAIMPSRSGLPTSTVNRYLTITRLGTSTVTITEMRTSTNVPTLGYTAAYALLGPSVGPLSGFLPPNQTDCTYLYGTDHNTYSLYNVPPNYPTGDVSVYGQYLTWEPFPQDTCMGIRIYVTSISR
jgi:hypothetical protein